MPTLIEQRAELQTAVEESRDRFSEAKQRADRNRRDAGEAVTADLRKFRDDIRFSKPTAVPVADRPDRHRQLTADLLFAIEQRGWLVEAVETIGGWGLAVVDPTIDTDLEEALRAKGDAIGALSNFDRDNADDLAAEQKAATAKAVKAALDSGDPDLINAALARRDEQDHTALERTHAALISGEYEGWEDDALRSRSLHSDALTTADLP